MASQSARMKRPKNKKIYRVKRTEPSTSTETAFPEIHYCTRCGATLDTQTGFSPTLYTWVCTECGQFLHGDNVYEGEKYPNVMWYCDSCKALLNIQSGFSDLDPTWKCTQCGYTNELNLILEFRNPLWDTFEK